MICLLSLLESGRCRHTVSQEALFPCFDTKGKRTIAFTKSTVKKKTPGGRDGSFSSVCLSLDYSIHIKSPVQWCLPVISGQDPWGFLAASLGEMMNSRFNRDSVSKSGVGGAGEMALPLSGSSQLPAAPLYDGQHPLLTSAHKHTHRFSNKMNLKQ